MASNKITNVYIYLGRRDKSGIRIILISQGQAIMATRLENVDALGLSMDIANQIKQIIYDNRIYWEPWIQSDDTFDDFRAALKIRGYTNIPLSSQPEIYSTTSSTTVNIKLLPQKTTMVRKGS